MRAAHQKLVSRYKLAILNELYLAEPYCIIEMLSQTLSAIMIDVDCKRIQEVFLQNSMLNHRVLNITNPLGRFCYVSSNPSPHVGERLCQLATSPHVSIAKEKFRSLDAVSCDCGLNSHLKEFVYIPH